MKQYPPEDVSLFRQKIYRIIFEADTKLGKAFDIVLLWSILLSIGAVLLESVQPIREHYQNHLRFVEWFFTILFSLEYFIRIYCVRRPSRYIFSFFGLVDLLAILPTYLSFFFFGAQSLLVIRGLRLLRVFRILKLGRYTKESNTLLRALIASRAKITVFLGAVLGIALIMGALMYLIEGEQSGFTSIPRSIYWAIVTLTTVGYGDISPESPLGQFLASILMILGYAILAVPTGIVSVELANVEKLDLNTKKCKRCGKGQHPIEAKFCLHCGEKL